MSRLALHRQCQNSQDWPRWHAVACRSLTLVGPNSAGLGYRRAELNVSPSTDRRMGFLPARSDWFSILGGIR